MVVSRVFPGIKVPEYLENYRSGIDYSQTKMNFKFLILVTGAECTFIGDIGRDIGRDDTLKTV